MLRELIVTNSYADKQEVKIVQLQYFYLYVFVVCVSFHLMTLTAYCTGYIRPPGPLPVAALRIKINTPFRLKPSMQLLTNYEHYFPFKLLLMVTFWKVDVRFKILDMSKYGGTFKIVRSQLHCFL